MIRDDVATRHARNHVKKRIGKYLVDVFNADTNTVWEFQGCLWHGCKRCYSRNTINPVNELSMHELTLEKVQFLKGNGYNVIEVWTCDIVRQLAADPAMKAFFDNYYISEELKPRQAFFGGRTNATRLLYEAQSYKKMNNVDFCGLCPWCNKYGEYPLGHPQIINENLKSVNEYFDLVKCSVLPLLKLHHPVLLYSTQGKLMFPLCRYCADTLQQEPCDHFNVDRTLQGTWITLELKKALEMGYTFVKMDEVWHFSQHTDALFRDYVDILLKIKQEASSFPVECDNDERKVHYVADYATREGIELDHNQISKNPGLKALAKLMLNSFSSECRRHTVLVEHVRP